MKGSFELAKCQSVLPKFEKELNFFSASDQIITTAVVLIIIVIYFIFRQDGCAYSDPRVQRGIAFSNILGRKLSQF